MNGTEAIEGLRGLLAPVERLGRQAARRGLLRWILLGLPTAALAWLALEGLLEKTGGVPAAPLDDSYIHLQYARNIALGEPLRYSPEAPPVSGATSLLWPALLAIAYLFGFREHALLWPAWCLGFVSLGFLAHEAERAAAGFLAKRHAVFAAALVLAFGANSWFAGSGMEVMPLSWLLLRSARRAGEWWDAEGAQPHAGVSRAELVALAWLGPMLRPEGVLATVSIACVLLLKPNRNAPACFKHRALAWLSVLGSFGPACINWLLTGHATTTTMRAKWLPLNPYTSLSALMESLWQYVELLLGTLLNGEVWSALFLPKGSRFVLLAGLLALMFKAVRGPHKMRAGLLVLLALGILTPGTFECPLCNRLRYLWPFFPAWLLGVVALADLVGAALARLNDSLSFVSPGLLGVTCGGLLGYLPFAVQDLGTSASAIQDQQVSLGLWARDALPKQARIGVNDTGAIAYFSERPTFDVVGLTTEGEAEHWTAGTGSRFEHYERLGPPRLPTHFIVYPEWFALDELCGEILTERYVPGATILGGERMLACRADYSSLGSAETPSAEVLAGFTVLDRLDVADLVSERAHAYQLLDATQRDNAVLRFGMSLDGARRNRERDEFELRVRGGGRFVLRLASPNATWVEVRLGGRKLRSELPASVWHEVVLDVPSDLPDARHAVTVEGEALFTSLHYFSLVRAD